MVDSLYYSSRKIPERCKNSFVDHRINYQKLCYLIRQITKDLNSATICHRFVMLSWLHMQCLHFEANYEFEFGQCKRLNFDLSPRAILFYVNTFILDVICRSQY